MKLATFLALIGLWIFPAAAQVETPETFLEDPAQEARVQALSGEIRCPVCDGQSVRGSHAPLAVDLRRIIREQVASGKTDAEVKEYMRRFMMERYGEEALQTPPLSGDTVLLWFAPLLILLGGLALAWRLFSGTPANTDDSTTD